MAHYNIELRTDSHVATAVSVESQDLTALRIELASFVGQMLKEHALQIWVDEDWRVDVTDHTGLILFVMEISASNSPATKPLRR